jgi:hypothetical protein
MDLIGERGGPASTPLDGTLLVLMHKPCHARERVQRWARARDAPVAETLPGDSALEAEDARPAGLHFCRAGADSGGSGATRTWARPEQSTVQRTVLNWLLGEAARLGLDICRVL